MSGAKDKAVFQLDSQNSNGLYGLVPSIQRDSLFRFSQCAIAFYNSKLISAPLVYG